jgi:hypothetical protein
MDEQGVETRSGKRIGWTEVTSVRKQQYVMGRKSIAEEVIFSSPRGRFSLHTRRIGNYEELTRFALQRVPPAAIGPGP